MYVRSLVFAFVLIIDSSLLNQEPLITLICERREKALIKTFIVDASFFLGTNIELTFGIPKISMI